jgi:selenocysteine lyase/cysteine desulfurase
VEAIVNIPARGADGAPRPMAALSRGLEQALDALPPSRRALVVLADVTKTGLISLDPAAVFAAARRHAGRVEVLVDACQFRLAPTGLRAYLDNGAMVAVTGSKFLGGPSFSGALFVPPPLAGRFGEAAVEANPGLLLRWEAALAEFESFAALADETVDQTLRTFAAVVTRAIEAEPGLELLTAPPLDRSALGPAGWDSVPTIFSFLLRHGAGGPWFSRAQTHQVYRTLATRAGVSLLLGQPVACGRRDGMEVSALRFCASAPLVVEAAGESGRAAVLDRIGAAFSDIAGFARTMPAG